VKGLNVVVGRLNIEFHAEIFYPGELDIGSTVSRILVLRGHARVFRDGTCVASAVASCVLLQGGKPYAIPDDVRLHLLGDAGDRSGSAGA
jgi:acyl-CoA thioester hydrolase